jgi:hypothetical protein
LIKRRTLRFLQLLSNPQLPAFQLSELMYRLSGRVLPLSVTQSLSRHQRRLQMEFCFTFLNSRLMTIHISCSVSVYTRERFGLSTVILPKSVGESVRRCTTMLLDLSCPSFHKVQIYQATLYVQRYCTRYRDTANILS